MSSRRWAFALISLPIAAATALVGPGMVSRADGCSGGPGTLSPGWNGLVGFEDLTAPATAVVALQGSVKGMSESDALAAVTVEVTDSAAQPVSGSLSLHDMGVNAQDMAKEARNVLLVWKPDAPLQVDADYQVSWQVAGASAHPPSSGQVALSTVGAPAPAAAVVVGQSGFRRERRLTGEAVSCKQAITNSCGSGWSSFGSTELQVPLMDVTFSAPPSATTRYQLTRIEAVPGKGQLASLPEPFVDAPPSDGFPHSVTLEFADDVPEYCVRLVTEDLTDGSVTHWPDVCVERNDLEAPGPSLLEQRLASCEAPPSAALEPSWCASHPDAAQCAETSGGCSQARESRAPAPAWLGALALALGALSRRRR